MDQLVDLFCAVRDIFYTDSTDKYMAAMGEVGRLAWAAGYTINNVAQAAQGEQT